MKRLPKVELTAELARQILDYDPETGLMNWRVDMCRAKAGTNAGSTDKYGYRIIGIMGKRYKLHSVAFFIMTGRWPVEIDHEDRDRSNNKWTNLREANRNKNQGNVAKYLTNTSGFKGVYFHKANQKWVATITDAGKATYLGSFSKPEEAHEAYCVAAVRVFGEFARAA